MRTVVLCATLAAIAVPSGARAQSLPLTESDALSRLSPDSPRVRAIRAAVEVARADVLAAGRWPNPRLTFDRESVAGITESMWMIAQPLPISGRRGLEQQAASALVDAASNRTNDAVRRARVDLRVAFAQLVAAQIRERDLTTARDRLQGLAETLAKREAAGDASGFDRLRAEREVLDIDADRAGAAIDRARAQASLEAFFAELIDSARIEAVPRTVQPAALPAIEALVERAVSTRGELLALRREIDAARLGIEAGDRRWIPEPEIVGGTKSSNLAGGDIGGVFAVNATLPLFDHGRAERGLAAARESQAKARADAFLVALRTEIAALRAAVLARRDTAERYRNAAVNNAGDIERIARVSYDAGERGILELLDAYRIGSSARIRQAVLDLAVREAELELEFVSGWEMP
jgi:cobalt-zinc-cadmium efflux system outer membrane protein